MTISGTATSITIDGDGLTSVFSYNFYMGGSANYAVLVLIDSAGAETTIAAADFSITGVTSQSGGTFTYPLVGSPIAVGEQLRLSRVLPLTQNAAIGNQSSFYPSVIEGALDNLEMQIQQVAAGSGATIDAASLFGNSGSSAGAGSSIPIGSGLSFSGNTLVVSGISGSGTVTQIDTGTGLSGGPITGIGTITMSTITTGMVLANYSGATAAPQGVTVTAGSGITLSSTTTSLTIAVSGGVAGMSFITSSTPTGTGVVTFDSIPQTYKHLFLLASGRSDASGNNRDMNLTFNNDTGANYDSQRSQNTNTTINAAAGMGGTSALIGFVGAAGGTAGFAGYGECHIFNYTNTALDKLLKFSAAYQNTTSAGGILVWEGYAGWRSTASITRLDITLSSGNWVTGSIASLYGLT